VEQALAKIWGQALGLDRVGIHHEFFDLGGHSLLATQVISRLNERLDAAIPLRTLFEHPTIAEWTGAVENILVAETEPLSDEAAVKLLG